MKASTSRRRGYVTGLLIASGLYGICSQGVDSGPTFSILNPNPSATGPTADDGIHPLGVRHSHIAIDSGWFDLSSFAGGILTVRAADTQFIGSREPNAPTALMERALLFEPSFLRLSISDRPKAVAPGDERIDWSKDWIFRPARNGPVPRVDLLDREWEQLIRQELEKLHRTNQMQQTPP
jgi:hypothetical protein